MGGNGLGASLNGRNDEGPALDVSLPTIFERTAATHQARTALLSRSWNPSYAELNAAANRVAHAVLVRGGAIGDRIAILMQHDTPAIAAILAVLKAGRIVLTLNPTNPPARLRELIDDAEPACIVTDSENYELAFQAAGSSDKVIRFNDASAGGPDLNPSIAIRSEETAFLVYTSGSTGRPKGVMKTHRQIVADAAMHAEALEYNSDDRVPLLGSLSHGQAIIVMWSAIVSGATLCPFAVIVKGVAGLAEWMVDQGVNVYISSASIFRSFMQTLDRDFKFPNVHLVWVCSEAATSDDFRLFQQHFSRTAKFVHTYASSETSNMGLSRLSPDDRVSEGRLPMPAVSKTQEILLLDEHGQPVRRGEVGEIVVKSHTLAAGYWRNPALTAEKFLVAADGSGMRLFHTGDLARLNSSNVLEFVGRQGTRVKIRGNTIELAEVESALLRISGVDRAVVEAIARESCDAELVAFATIAGGYAWSSSELRRALRAVLPSHMVPSRVVLLDQLPLAPAGKIDRQKLRQEHSPVRELKSGQQPVTETEALLAGIWARVFALTDIGRSDDFFELGGDSLMAAVAAAELHAAIGVELDLKDFADYPSLAELAGFIDECRRAVPVRMLPLTPTARDKPLPLSSWQERIWIFSQTPKQSAGYTVAKTYHIVGPLDVDILQACMDFMVRRHEILRTTFAPVDGHPAQIIHPPAAASLKYVDMAAEPNPEREADLIWKQEAASTFDLGRGPLLRFTLLRLRNDEHVLLRVGHHILSDNKSWDIYFEELAGLYEAKARGHAPPFPDAAPLQYGDYAVWQRKMLSPTEQWYQKSLVWWTSNLSGAPPALGLPFLRAKTKQDVVPADGLITWGIEHAVSHRLNHLGTGRGITRSMVRLAAFAALLADEAGQSDVIIGMYVSSRNRLALHNMIGVFFNLTTFRFRFDATKSFRQWLSIVRDDVVNAEAYSGIPYERLREELQRNGVRVPEIKVIFQFSNLARVIKFADLKISWMNPPPEQIPWGLTMYCDEQKEEDDCRVHFDPRLYDRTRVSRLVDRYRRLLDVVSRQPDKTLEELLSCTKPH